MTLGRFLSIPNARPERLNVASNPLYETGLDSIFPVRGLHDSLGTQMLGTGGALLGAHGSDVWSPPADELTAVVRGSMCDCNACLFY